MNEYMKPDYEVMVFEANEYVAACPWVQGTELIVGCGNGSVQIQLNTNQGSYDGESSVWSASPYNPTSGIYVGGSEMLYPVYDKYTEENKEGYFFTGDYAYCGTISDNHTSTTSGGEWMSQGNGNVPGNVSGNATVCDCYLFGQSGALVNALHHHLTHIRNKNMS